MPKGQTFSNALGKDLYLSGRTGGSIGRAELFCDDRLEIFIMTSFQNRVKNITNHFALSFL